MLAQRLLFYILGTVWRIAVTICLILCASAPVLAQGGSIYGQVVSPAGYPVAFASVRICPITSTGDPCTPLAASLWADPAMTVPVANPYTTDGFGNYSVFVPPALYYIVQVSFISNQQPYTYAYLEAASSNSVATAAPQYTIAIYTQPGLSTTIGEGFVDPTNAQLRTDGAGGLYVPGPTQLFGTLVVAGQATGPIFDALTGFQVASAAPLNHVLVGNGTNYVDASTIPSAALPALFYQTFKNNGTTLPQRTFFNSDATLTMTDNGTDTTTIGMPAVGANATFVNPASMTVDAQGRVTSATNGTTILYYQTVDANNTPLTQRAVLNFAPRLTATDSSSPAETTIDLPSTVTAGSCTTCSLTYDTYGRITAASTPATLDQYVTFNGCAFANDGSGVQCNTTAAFSSPFADTSYSMVCALYSDLARTSGGNVPSIMFIPRITSVTGFTFYEETQTGSSGGWGIDTTYEVTVTCHGHHA